MAQDGLIGTTFVELADTLVEGYDVIEFVQLLTLRCVELLGVTEAGVALADLQGDLRLLASSSERMRVIELIELQRQEGPCFECWRDGDPVRADDLDDAVGRWPNFVPAAVAAGFRSVYALPMRPRTERIGALNLFADVPGCLGREDEALGQALADVATIGILHERFLRERDILTQQLQTALNGRVSLEQAKGIVSEQAGVDVDQAFDLLRRHARSHSRYLSDVVADVINRNISGAELADASASRNIESGP